MNKKVDLKHSVIKEDSNELLNSQARYKGPDIDDQDLQDLDIYSKCFQFLTTLIDLHRESKELVLHGEQEINKVSPINSQNKLQI